MTVLFLKSACSHNCSIPGFSCTHNCFISLLRMVTQLHHSWVSLHTQILHSRARIFKLLKGPRIDAKKPIPPGCVAGGPVRHPFPIRFLAPIDCLKIPSQLLLTKYFHSWSLLLNAHARIDLQEPCGACRGLATHEWHVSKSVIKSTIFSKLLLLRPWIIPTLNTLGLSNVRDLKLVYKQVFLIEGEKSRYRYTVHLYL